MSVQAVVAAKPEVPPPAPHEDWNETVEPVTSWAEEAPAPAPAAATTFGAPAAQEDWAAQVPILYLLIRITFPCSPKFISYVFLVLFNSYDTRVRKSIFTFVSLSPFSNINKYLYSQVQDEWGTAAAAAAAPAPAAPATATPSWGGSAQDWTTS